MCRSRGRCPRSNYCGQGQRNQHLLSASGFLTLSFEAMKKTVEGLEAIGLRNKVKVMIGGGQIDGRVKDFAGADAYGLDAMEAVKLAKQWIGG